jgi:hypothetical protein
MSKTHDKNILIHFMAQHIEGWFCSSQTKTINKKAKFSLDLTRW